MNSAAHLPTRIRLLGTEYAVEQHKSVVFLVGVPRGGQHALLTNRTTGELVSDGFPGLRFARDLSSATKRSVPVALEVLAASDEVCGNVDVWSRECWVATDVAPAAHGACS